MDDISNVFVVNWSVQNFLFLWRKKGKCLTSPAFVMNGLDNVKWFLDLYPRGDLDNEQYISLFLRKEKNEYPNDVTVEFELSYFHMDGRVKTRLKRSEKVFSTNGSLTWGCAKLVARQKVVNELAEFKSEACFIVRCRMWIPNDAKKVNGLCLLRTHIGIQRCAFTWVVGQFTETQIHEKKSTVVSLATSKHFPVKLTSYISYGPKCDEQLNVEIEPASKKIYALCKLKLLDEDESVGEFNVEEFWLNKRARAGKPLWKLQTFSSRQHSSQKGYFSERNIRLHCDFVFSTGVVSKGAEETLFGTEGLKRVSHSIESDYSEMETDQHNDNNNSGTLKSDQQFFHKEYMMCDAKLETPTSVFPVHRAILCARSPVFRAIFDFNTKEKSSSDSVGIADLDDNTVRRLLQFLYTDSVGCLEVSSAKKLYLAGYRYQIVQLREKCADFLSLNLSVANVCQVLILADTYQDEKLKKSTTDFILKSNKDVFASKQWKKLMKRYIHLADHIMLLKCT